MKFRTFSLWNKKASTPHIAYYIWKARDHRTTKLEIVENVFLFSVSSYIFNGSYRALRFRTRRRMKRRDGDSRL